jgi:RHS repeat-associated protein
VLKGFRERLEPCSWWPTACRRQPSATAARPKKPFACGCRGVPPGITLAYGEATNRITTSGYTYDLNGNLTAMPSVNGGPAITGIQWDVLDRMTQATANGSTTSYKYDAFGRRVESSTWPYGYPVPRVYFYDMGGRLLAEYGNVYAGATPTKKYEYFAGQQLGQYKDRVGSVRNTNGGVSSHYYPFGEEITSTANDRYKFAETFRDADSGLDYALNRYYASGIGRFLSPDRGGKSSANPANPMSWNRYSYADNDPINRYDPAGMVTVAVGDGWFVECNFFDTGDPFCYVWAFGPGPGPAPPPIGSGGTVGSGAVDSFAAAQASFKGAAQDLAKKGKFKKRCEDDFRALHVTDNQVRTGAASAVFLNGVGSDVTLASLYATSPVQSIAAQAAAVTGTVGDLIASKASTTVAVAQLGGPNIYLNPGAINPADYWQNIANVLHEVLHNVTGLTDPDIERLLHLPETEASDAITQKLKKDCF